MDTSQAEADEEMLTFNIPDEALERAASAEQQATYIVRIHGITVSGHSSP
jgi:hypothetical protein